MDILDKLVKNNELPIMFVGSGISKRYLNDFPDWKQLLLRLWLKTKRSEDAFYSQMLLIRNKIAKTCDVGATHDSSCQEYALMATSIEETFNDMFARGEIEVESFSCKDAVSEGISPFKMEISNITKSLIRKHDKEEEISSFKKALLKSRTIFTTNYDCLIESIVENEFNVFYQQSDLFLSPDEFGDIFKVHGCSKHPNSLVITKSDYDIFYDNSVLISAKLISLLMVSPIIFIGYSLKDEDIANILSRFTQSLRPDQRATLQERLIYIEYAENTTEIQEMRQESEALNAQMTVIKTDNFKYVFDKLSQIDQGMPIAQIRMFTDKIRQLIIERGRVGSLRTLLISPYDLNDSEVQDDHLVVAIGENTVVFNYPDRLEYLKDYMKQTPEISKTVALVYISQSALKTRIPIFKHLNGVNLDDTHLRTDQKDKIQQKQELYVSVKPVVDSIPHSYKIRYNNIQEISGRGLLLYKELDEICYNIERFNLDDVERYIIDVLNDIQFSEWDHCKTQLSRLVVAWDILNNRKGS